MLMHRLNGDRQHRRDHRRQDSAGRGLRPDDQAAEDGQRLEDNSQRFKCRRREYAREHHEEDRVPLGNVADAGGEIEQEQ